MQLASENLTTTASQTTNRGGGDTLDLVVKNFAVKLGAALAETFATFSTFRLSCSNALRWWCQAYFRQLASSLSSSEAARSLLYAKKVIPALVARETCLVPFSAPLPPFPLADMMRE